MRNISIALAALLVFAGAAAASPTTTVEVDSTLTLKFKEGSDLDGDYYEEGTGDLFFGKVSARKRCRQDRKVRIFAAAGGRIGKDVTDRQGRFSISVENAAPGRYFVQAKKRTYRNEKGTKKVVCLAAG